MSEDAQFGVDEAPAEPEVMGPEPTGDDRLWSMIAHGIWLLGIGFLLGPLIIWLVKKDESPFVAHHAREALNFHITMMIVGIPLSIVCFILIITVVGLLIAIPLLAAYSLYMLVVTILALIKVNENEYWRYPFTLRLIA